ncbi:MAG: hypothetical protein LLG04_02590 [Parachlamydia sp.]|nr:hypothetical protein [Parachlamydia sp.]
MIHSLSAFPCRILPFLPKLFPRVFHKIRPAVSPKQAESLARRKIERQTPSFAPLAFLPPEEINKRWSEHLEKVSKELLGLPGLAKPDCAPIRAQLKKVLDSLEMKNLELFFDKLAQAEIARPSAKEVDEVMKLIDLKKMEALLKTKNPFFKDATDWAKEHAGYLGEKSPDKKPATAEQAARTRNVVSRFFPNLAHVLFRAFNLFDTERPPATLYEYGVLITMYFHFFYIPYLLFKVLSTVIASSATVLLTATAIIGLTVGALYTYLRWIKKCPKQVIYCENLSEKHRKGQLHPVVGREEEFRQALSCLNDAGRGSTMHLLLIGETGVGKTEFMNGLAQRLANREVYKFKNWSLFGAPNAIQSPGEKMEESFREVRGFASKTVFFCDELGDAKELPNFLKPVLTNESIQFVGAMTREQYENLKRTDKAFEERFKPIFLNATDKKQTIRILNEKMRRCAPDISYSQDSLEKIFDLSQNQGYCQPRKAVSHLDELINRVHQFRIDSYATPEFYAAQDALNCLKARGLGFDSPLRRPLSKECVDYLSDCAKARQRLEGCERQVNQQRQQARRMKDLLGRERKMELAIDDKARQYAHHKGTVHGLRRFLFDSFFLYPRLGEMVEKIATGVNQGMPLRIDEVLVRKVIEQDQANRRAAGAA